MGITTELVEKDDFVSDKPIATTSLRIVVSHKAKLRRLNHVTYESLPEDRTDGQQHKSVPKLKAK